MSEENIDSLTLQDLSGQTGFEPRTIRSYVEKGVLPGPESLGRGARYPRETLDRLKVLRLLRDAHPGLSLDQIRVVLQRIGPSMIHAVAEGHKRIGDVIDAEALALPAAPADGALHYLMALKTESRNAFKTAAFHPGASGRHAPQDQPVFEQAAQALAALAGLKSSAGSVRSEHWHRLTLTPDIELSVRGHFDTEQLAQFHRIGQALRVLLTKGASS